MNTTSIQDKIREIVTDYSSFSVSSPAVFSALLFEDDLGFDSLDVAEIALRAETEFNITISDAETGRLDKVSDLEKLVQTKLGNG